MQRQITLLALIVGCGGGDNNNDAGVTNATSLNCPFPGALPFQLASHGFQSTTNRTLVRVETRSKDEAADVIGNAGGSIAPIYLNAGDASTAMPIDYRGRKARTVPPVGLLADGLGGENVSLWEFDGAMWNTIGRTTTEGDGHYEVPDSGFVAANGQPVYAVLEADGSCAESYDYLLPAGSKVVVADIDGTLTVDNTQLGLQVVDADYVPKMMGAAHRLTQAWAAKGYTIVYLTARPHLFRTETRVWLRDQAFATGPLVTAGDDVDTIDYKTGWLARIMGDFGWTVIAAYGNERTDIAAYENVGIPKTQTFIVGELAGEGGTVAIANLDFSDHIATYVAAQPDNAVIP